MPRKRFIRRLLAGVISAGLVLLGQSALPAAAAGGGPDLAAGAPATASTSHAEYGVANVNDGNQTTYWESANNAFPQWVQVDLGSSTSIDQVVLKLPRRLGGPERDPLGPGQPRRLQPSPRSPARPATASTPARATRSRSTSRPRTPGYVRLNITANTGWPAAQISELEVHGAADLDGQPRPGPDAHREQRQRALRRRQRQRRQPGHLLGEHQQRLPAVDPGRPRVPPSPVNRVVLKLPPVLGGPDADAVPAGQHHRLDLQPTWSPPRGYAFNPATGNTVTINFSRDHHPLPAAQRHRQHRLAGRAAVGVRGLRPGHRRHHARRPRRRSLAYTQPGSGQIRLTWNAVDRQRRRHRLRRLRQRRAAHQRRRQRAHLHRRPARHRHRQLLRAGQGRGRQPVSGNSNTVTRTGTGGDTQAPTAPGEPRPTPSPASGQIRLTWTASTDNVGVTGYDVYANGALRATVPGSVLTYTDTPAGHRDGVLLREGQGRRGQPSAQQQHGHPHRHRQRRLQPGRRQADHGLRLGLHASSPANANDNRRHHLLGGRRRQLPEHADRARSAPTPTSARSSLKLNPDSAWGTRTQTIQVLGREQSATGFTSLVARRPRYTFNPASGNTVTIPVSATVADVQLRFTANTGAPGRPGRRVPGHRHPGAEPGPHRHRHVRGPRRPRSRPTPITLSATVRNIGTAASGADERQLLPGHHQGRHRRGRRAGGRRVRHRDRRTSAPRTRAATR